MNRVGSKLKYAADWLQQRWSAKALILMYHRVADVGLDPWALSVTPKHFAEHLEVIQQHAQPMSLQQLAQAHRNGQVPHRAVALTFDDGYVDNLLNAKPLLERYDIPATIFITTGYLDSQQEFWWDELERVLLQPGQLPEVMYLTIDGKPRQWHLGRAANYSLDEYHHDRDRRAWQSKPGSRMQFYYSVWGVLRGLPEAQRQLLQEEILAWANATPIAREGCRALSTEELIALGDGDFIEIGAHTVTHPSLPNHSADTQWDEIQHSKDYLEQLLSRPVQSFAYPFGDFNQDSIQAVRENSFHQACSTVQSVVWKGCDRFQLPRVEVQNWNRQTFEKTLLNWLA